jgi:hypothetical protein
MRWTLVFLFSLAAPVAFGATHTVGLEVGHGQVSGLTCAAVAGNPCTLSDDAWRAYYGIAFSRGFGARFTLTTLDNLRLTTNSNAIFFPDVDSVRTRIDDLSATYSFPLSKVVSLTASAGVARWEEGRLSFGARVLGFAFTDEGYSPALGLKLDFGSGLLRAGLSFDLYPSIGDTDHARYYGAGLRAVW